MSATIKLQDQIRPKAEAWILRNVGPRLFYLHNSMGGEGWIIKRNYRDKIWELTFEDEKLATFFAIKFSS